MNPRRSKGVGAGARLFLSPGAIAFVGGAVAAAEHRHYAIQISVGLEQPIRACVGGRQLEACGLLIPSEVPHDFESSGRTMIFLIEPEGEIGRALASRGVGVDISAELPDQLGDPSNAEPWAFEESLQPLLRRLAGASAPEVPEPGPIVRSALEYVERSIAGSPRLEAAARAAAISPSRLTHLFSEEVGIPFRRYILWLRLRLAVQSVRDGANLTEAAVEAGFADSAHLTRVFKETFGIPPSMALGRMEIAGALWHPATGDNSTATFK